MKYSLTALHNRLAASWTLPYAVLATEGCTLPLQEASLRSKKATGTKSSDVTTSSSSYKTPSFSPLSATWYEELRTLSIASIAYRHRSMTESISATNPLSCCVMRSNASTGRFCEESPFPTSKSPRFSSSTYKVVARLCNNSPYTLAPACPARTRLRTFPRFGTVRGGRLDMLLGSINTPTTSDIDCAMNGGGGMRRYRCKNRRVAMGAASSSTWWMREGIPTASGNKPICLAVSKYNALVDAVVIVTVKSSAIVRFLLRRK
mmetsp:Transcript_43242/g.104725  ORF Transcript_43242/g.104725 Transcript_43242/m.104725 type:complete len:262 (-) Transcript_43242:1682-2467(-)